jgi:hypothetical protein
VIDMSDEEREQHDDIKQPPPDEIARRVSAPPDPVAKWRREADERVRQRQEAELVAAGETASRQWIEQRLERERQLIFDVVGEALGQAIAEGRKSSTGDNFLAGEVAALWKALADVQGSIAKIYEDRVAALRSESAMDAKKLN